MARRPNYKFERMERDRAKAAKKTARLEAKKKKVDERNEGGDELVDAPAGEAPTDASSEAPTDD